VDVGTDDLGRAEQILRHAGREQKVVTLALMSKSRTVRRHTGDLGETPGPGQHA
jgi:hypothetical protein